SRRIDNQLRGRSGRQGDPGESRFYLSLEDNLMRIFNGEMIQKIMDRMNVPDDEPIMARMVSRSIEGAQRKVEGHNFDIRKHLLDYDNVMNQQRTIIYGMRRQIMNGENVDRTMLDFMGDVTSNILDAHVPVEGKTEDWNLEALNTALTQQFGIRIEFSSFPHLDGEIITSAVSKAIKDIYDRQKLNLGQFFAQIQKMVLLQSIDQRWKEHLALIDRLKEGIGLRGYSGKDPVIEYKKEAFNAFSVLNQQIKADCVERLLKVQIVTNEQGDEMESMLRAPDMDELEYHGADESSAGGGINMMAQQQPRPQGQPDREPEAPQKQRMRMTAGPSQGQPERQLNRAERRKTEKSKR
ncbi:MAG: preprotein translocase subunit SecA, partial [Pseudobdellovibrionaceae bacterium]